MKIGKLVAGIICLIVSVMLLFLLMFGTSWGDVGHLIPTFMIVVPVIIYLAIFVLGIFFLIKSLEH